MSTGKRTIPADAAPARPPQLRDLLAHLSPRKAEKLLGADGRRLLVSGRRHEIDVAAQVRLTPRRLQVKLPEATVTIAQDAGVPGRLAVSCTTCAVPCEHAGAALATVLDAKVAMGLAAPPDARTPDELLGDDELVAQQLEERAERARTERMQVRALDREQPWSGYVVTSRESGKSYRVELRGMERGESFCTCPDFRKNTLGTCKHILHVQAKVGRRFPKGELRRPYERTRISLSIGYGQDMTLRLLPPSRCPDDVLHIAEPFAASAVDAASIRKLLGAVRSIEALGHDVLIYPDAEELIESVLDRDHLAQVAAEIRRDPAGHDLRHTLLHAELLPYQLDGIAFAVGAGRAILADDMGLGKTIQAIGTAELLAREAGIERVLVVCPASVKSQWLGEIRRFCGRSAHSVVGPSAKRGAQYAGPQFFTVCNYEQILRDLSAIEAVPWDLIVLDEAQRIKNWEAKTARVVKSLRSPFALVLTGTPLENRLDELYSIVEFIDERRLGPAFRFFHSHRIVDEDGRVRGFRNLDRLRETLAPMLLRRTRDLVMRDLPERSTQIIRITPTEEQLEIHAAQMRVVTSIVNKAWLSEVDLLRLQKALLLCRMAANSTYLVTKERPAYSTKLERLGELFDDLLAEEHRKIVLFSEWTTMLDEIETVLAPRLASAKAVSVRLDGKVPQQKRQELVRRFREDADCRVFLTTNAGSTGLNLQAADTVVNVDLPWNPALLEQRIGRAHRMGQKKRVQVYLLVTEGTLEENMLGTLSAKHELFRAVLDPDSEIDAVELRSGMEELKRRLEVLLGQRPPAPIDESEGQRVRAAADAVRSERERVADAGGRLLAAAFDFLGELLPTPSFEARDGDVVDPLVNRLRDGLGGCVEDDADGRPKLTVTLPDRAALDRLADSLARLLAGRGDQG